jgi:hypothetical protein
VQYRVLKDDDMLGIALRFGISLAALKTANPTVNPHFLSVGMTLIIPVTVTPTVAPAVRPGQTTATATPLPVEVEIDPPVCYPVLPTGSTCLALAHNRGQSDLENVTVEFQWQDSQNPPLTQSASTPLDLLAPGAALPVSVTFPTAVQAGTNVTARLSGALPHPAADTRYISAALTGNKVTLQNNSAAVSGVIHTGSPAQEAWALAVAYGADGALLGMRKWESSGSPTGQDTPFSLTVYSLGSEITRVEVFVEAHAAAGH